MTGEPREPKRVLGFPVGQDPYRRDHREAQRLLGVPTDWIGPVDVQWFHSLIHPIRSWKRWIRHRRLGPYDIGDDDDGGDGTKPEGRED